VLVKEPISFTLISELMMFLGLMRCWYKPRAIKSAFRALACVFEILFRKSLELEDFIRFKVEDTVAVDDKRFIPVLRRSATNLL
jgi:hypothetical protein